MNENIENWDIYDYIEEHNLLHDGLGLCENDAQRESLISYTKKVCKLYQPLINNVKKMIKTDLDRENFVKSLLGVKDAH